MVYNKFFLFFLTIITIFINTQSLNIQSNNFPSRIEKSTFCLLANSFNTTNTNRAIDKIQHTELLNVTGDMFRSLADHIFDERKSNLDTKSIKDKDIIFVKNDWLDRFFKQHHPNIQAPYILVSHNSAAGVTKKYIPYLDDPKIIVWFGVHAEISHPKLIPIPDGLANPRWPHGNIKVIERVISQLPVVKHTSPLVHINFTLHPKLSLRKKIFDMFNKKPFCFVAKKASWEHYLQEMAQYKFTLSPRGIGIDSLRTWEALLVNTIPIIESSSLDPLYQDLPVLIVKKWENISEDFLNEQYEIITSKSHNLEKLHFSFWNNLIRKFQE